MTKRKTPRIIFDLHKLPDRNIEVQFQANTGCKSAVLKFLEDNLRNPVNTSNSDIHKINKEVPGKQICNNKSWVPDEAVKHLDYR